MSLTAIQHFPLHLLRRFWHAACEEVGREELTRVLWADGFSTSLVDESAIETLEGAAAVECFSGMQAVLRRFYGRGTLLRIGRNIWAQVLEDASLLGKAELEVLRRLPFPARRQRIIKFVAAILQAGAESTAVHLLDTDLLLVDRASPGTWGQVSPTPICHVTMGILEAALLWGTGKDASVEEIACRAAGSQACEFKICLGKG